MHQRIAKIAPAVKPWLLGPLLILLVGCGLGAGATYAQAGSRPLLDGLTVGPGVATYIGDLDGNPGGNLVQYLANGQFSFMVAGDRRHGRLATGLELHFDRMKIDRQAFEMTNNILSLDLVGGYHVDMIRRGFLRFTGGVGVSLLMPSYQRFPDNAPGVDKRGTRPILTFPLGITVQNRLRLGLRLTATDFLDGFEGTGSGSIDLISFIHVGYRFRFDN